MSERSLTPRDTDSFNVKFKLMTIEVRIVITIWETDARMSPTIPGVYILYNPLLLTVGGTSDLLLADRL